VIETGSAHTQQMMPETPEIPTMRRRESFGCPSTAPLGVFI
jgi:hypothetical protein